MKKAVLRYRNGLIKKGELIRIRHDSEFVQIRDRNTDLVETARLSDLKAVFFVRNYEGANDYEETKDFSGSTGYGKKTIVRFDDGEELWGFTQGYSPDRAGFFLFPVDNQSNNQRVFVVNRSTEQVRFAQAS